MRNVVVFGCPRSGTSLLLEMFETLGWRTFFEPGADFVGNRLRKEAGGKPWALKNPVDHHVTAGLTCNLADLARWVDDVIYIWIVRHPLDTICSLRPGLEERWSHQPYPRDWVSLLREPWHIRAAGMWLWSNAIGYPQLTTSERFNGVVKYEDLVAEPRKMAVRICGWAGTVPLTTHVDTFDRKVSRNTGGPEAKIQDRWAKKDHTLHVGRWRENLTYAQVDQLRVVLGDAGRVFGYELPEVS